MKKNKTLTIATGKQLLTGAPELVTLQNKQLKSTLTMPESHSYADFCQTFLSNFAEFVQVLPASESAVFSNQGGVLLHAIDRACIATNMYRRQLAIEDAQMLSVPQALWMYVVFTSAMLHRLGHYINKAKVTLHHDNETSIWQPVLGAMNKTGFDRYEYEFKKGNDDYLSRVLTVVFAHQLMPKEALAWITKDDKVYRVWLALLEESWTNAGSMAGMVVLANIESVKNYFENLAYQRMELRPDKSSQETATKSFDDRFTLQAEATQMAESAAANEAGIAFLQWLQQNISANDVNGARSAIHVVNDGVLMVFPQTAELVKQFLEKNSQHGNIQNVIEKFSDLGITQADSAGNDLRKVRVGNESLPVNALLVTSPHAIFIEGTPPQSKVPYAMVQPHTNVDASIQQATAEAAADAGIEASAESNISPNQGAGHAAGK